MIWDARLILLVIVSFNFHFQKCRDPNPLLDPVGGSKLEPGLLRRFQSKHLFRFIKFLFSKVSRPRIPDLTRLADPSWSPVYSDIFNYLSKTCCLCYSILDLLIKQKHFFLGNPMTIYKFKRLITFTLNNMH